MKWLFNATPQPLYPRGKRPDTHFIGRPGRVRKILPIPGFDLWTIQPVTSKYVHFNYINLILTLNFK
jgi:hypothetical protein